MTDVDPKVLKLERQLNLVSYLLSARAPVPFADIRGRVVGYVSQVGHVIAEIADPASVLLEQVETLPSGEPNIVRCPDESAALKMIELIKEVRNA